MKPLSSIVAILLAAVVAYVSLYLLPASSGFRAPAAAPTPAPQKEEEIPGINLNEFGVKEGEPYVFVDPENFFNKLSAHSKKKLYDTAASYWESVDPTDAGVLGGYEGEVMPDVRESHRQIEKYLKPILDPIYEAGGRAVVMDGGAGVGRVVKYVLQYYFHEIDLVEPANKLISEAQRRLDEQQQAGLECTPEQPDLKILADTFNYYNIGLQDIEPAPGRYDVIWIQGVLMYLNDDDVIKFFKNAALSLKPEGVIMVKENDATSAHYSWMDFEDGSMNRRADQYRSLIRKAGLRILLEDTHPAADKSLLPEQMYMLKPEG